MKKYGKPRLVAGIDTGPSLPSAMDHDGYGCADALYEAEARKHARYAVLRGKTEMSASITGMIGEEHARRLIAEALEELYAFETSAEGFAG